MRKVMTNLSAFRDARLYPFRAARRSLAHAGEMIKNRRHGRQEVRDHGHGAHRVHPGAVRRRTAGRYVFAYTITIHNTGTSPAQLVSRHWIITDADNQVQEVRGKGVVGEQPLLRPERELRVHQRHRDRDAGRHHARQLPDGGGGRRGVRRADPGIHAVDAARAALNGRRSVACGHARESSQSSARSRPVRSSSRRGQVHQTMKISRRERDARFEQQPDQPVHAIPEPVM